MGPTRTFTSKWRTTHARALFTWIFLPPPMSIYTHTLCARTTYHYNRHTQRPGQAYNRLLSRISPSAMFVLTKPIFFQNTACARTLSLLFRAFLRPPPSERVRESGISIVSMSAASRARNFYIYVYITQGLAARPRVHIRFFSRSHRGLCIYRVLKRRFITLYLASRGFVVARFAHYELMLFALVCVCVERGRSFCLAEGRGLFGKIFQSLWIREVLKIFLKIFRFVAVWVMLSGWRSFNFKKWLVYIYFM